MKVKDQTWVGPQCRKVILKFSEHVSIRPKLDATTGQLLGKYTYQQSPLRSKFTCVNLSPVNNILLIVYGRCYKIKYSEDGSVENFTASPKCM